MGLTGAQWWEVAVLFFAPRREFHIYRLQRNQEIIVNLVEAGQDFWFNHVIPRIPPPLDESEATRTLLKKLYPQDRGDIIPAPPNASEWLSRLQAAKEVMAEAEKGKALAEAHVKSYIGDNQGILSPEWKATWKRNRDSVKTDWQKAYKDLFYYALDKGINLNEDEFEGKHTTITPGPRVLRVVPVKEGR
jgi:predicted phage-related endonuclease